MKESVMNAKQAIANALTCAINDDMDKAKQHLATAIIIKSRQHVNESKKGKYYSLFVFDDGKWHNEFGDDSLASVKEEQREYKDKGKKCKIVTTSGDQKEISALLAKMNKTDTGK